MLTIPGGGSGGMAALVRPARAAEEPVADVNHRLDPEAEGRELVAQAVDVDVQALGVVRLAVAPRVTPQLLGPDDPLRVADEAGEEQELRAREPERLAVAGGEVVFVLDPQAPVVVDVGRRLA